LFLLLLLLIIAVDVVAVVSTGQASLDRRRALTGALSGIWSVAVLRTAFHPETGFRSCDATTCV
jgi:hypothetical protein